MEIAQLIRQRREELGLSQLEVLFRMAEKGLKRTPPTYQAWESGKQAPRADELRALAEALKTTVAWLFGEEADESATSLTSHPTK